MGISVVFGIFVVVLLGKKWGAGMLAPDSLEKGE